MATVLYFSMIGSESDQDVINQLNQDAKRHLAIPNSPINTSAHTDQQRPLIEQQQLAKQLSLALSGDLAHPLAHHLRHLQQYCQQQSACLNNITQHLPKAQQQQLAQLQQQQTVLAQRLANFPQNTHTDYSQRLANISALRQEVLGKENAKLLYGQEEAILAYQAAVDDFLKTTARSLSLTVRQQQLQQFKQQYLAEYLPVLNSYQEKGFNRYLEDLALAELDSKNNEQLAAIRLKTRQYYFGEQKAQQMAQQDQTQAEQQQRMAQYQHAKQQLLTKYGNNPNDSQYLA
ncbi:MAG TPA: lipase secretion chaperone, partial [Agitococcus sp.]|nr:lipase secretion chaperone [Agitococcus sp.]